MNYHTSRRVEQKPCHRCVQPALWCVFRSRLREHVPVLPLSLFLLPCFPAVNCSRCGRLLCTFHWHFFCSTAAVAFVSFSFWFNFCLTHSATPIPYTPTHLHTCDIVDDDDVAVVDIVTCVCDVSYRRLKFRALFCAKATGNVCAELFWNWNLIMYQQLWQLQDGSVS